MLRTHYIHARLNRVSVEVMGTEFPEHATQCRQDQGNLMRISYENVHEWATMRLTKQILYY